MTHVLSVSRHSDAPSPGRRPDGPEDNRIIYAWRAFPEIAEVVVVDGRLVATASGQAVMAAFGAYTHAMNAWCFSPVALFAVVEEGKKRG